MRRKPQGCRVFPDEEGTERLSGAASELQRAEVAEYSPMKRGLKGEPRAHSRRGSERVAEYSPMKRGLKGWHIVQFARGLIVAEYSPMKRGLKGFGAAADVLPQGRCRVFPDEEGTERPMRCCRPERMGQLQSIPR